MEGNIMNRFTLPRDIYFGENSLEVLKTIKGKKAVIVTGGSSMKKFGFLDKVEAYLKEAGIEVKHITGVEPDPSVETVMNYTHLRAHETRHDLVCRLLLE